MLNYNGTATFRETNNVVEFPFNTGIFDEVEYYFCGIGSSNIAVLDFAWGRSFTLNNQVFVVTMDGLVTPVGLGQVVIKGDYDHCWVLALGKFTESYISKEETDNE